MKYALWNKVFEMWAKHTIVNIELWKVCVQSCQKLRVGDVTTGNHCEAQVFFLSVNSQWINRNAIAFFPSDQPHVRYPHNWDSRHKYSRFMESWRWVSSNKHKNNENWSKFVIYENKAKLCYIIQIKAVLFVLYNSSRLPSAKHQIVAWSPWFEKYAWFENCLSLQSSSWAPWVTITFLL